MVSVFELDESYKLKPSEVKLFRCTLLDSESFYFFVAKDMNEIIKEYPNCNSIELLSAHVGITESCANKIASFIKPPKNKVKR